MNLVDIASQLEEELTWRTNELRFFRNILSEISDEAEKSRYRKAMVVMLYSHFEGYCKTAFLIYVNSINQTCTPRYELNDFLSAASFSDVFRTYSDGDKKHEYFKSILPDDAKLHLFARQVEFISNINKLLDRAVAIPESIVDLESNLKPDVLRKMLYRLGFNHSVFGKDEWKINRLIKDRNDVAHGAKKEGFSEDEYKILEGMVFEITSKIKQLILESLEEKRYLATSS